MRGIIIATLLFVVCILPYKPQNPAIMPIKDASAEKNLSKETTVKKTDSIQNVINKSLQKVENSTQLNNKLKEDNIRLQKLENQITAEIINAIIKERKVTTTTENKKYVPTADFKELSIEYKGETYHVIKDSVCVSYNRKSLFSKKICDKYDYFLKITK